MKHTCLRTNCPCPVCYACPACERAAHLRTLAREILGVLAIAVLPYLLCGLALVAAK